MRWTAQGSARFAAPCAFVLLLTGCPMKPPASQVPSAQAAIDRLRASGTCETGIQASAKIDHFGERGRVRGDLLMFVAVPSRIRMDIVSPFGVTIATLASDGKVFSLADLREKKFYVGPATACNIARLTTVPIPPHILVELLRGQPPVLQHAPNTTSIEWSGKGYYVVKIDGTRDAHEELHVAVNPADYGKPWGEQRMRLLDVRVAQSGIDLYHAALEGHAATQTAPPRVDPDGIDPPIGPSGPSCDAEIPRRIHVEVPYEDEDVLFRYDSVQWNPPLPEGTFTQPVPGGMPVVPVTCE
jgi:hypothetical protein